MVCKGLSPYTGCIETGQSRSRQKSQTPVYQSREKKHRLGTTDLNTTHYGKTTAACLVIYQFVSFQFSYDRFHPDGDRIYRVVRTLYNAAGEGSPGAGLTPRRALYIQRSTYPKKAPP